MNDIYQEYAFLEAQIKELEDKKDALRPTILKDLIDNGISKHPTPLGTFSIMRRKTWTYPENVLEAEDNYKALKAQSENTGDATYTEAESLKFNKIDL